MLFNAWDLNEFVSLQFIFYVQMNSRRESVNKQASLEQNLKTIKEIFENFHFRLDVDKMLNLWRCCQLSKKTLIRHVREKSRIFFQRED